MIVLIYELDLARLDTDQRKTHSSPKIWFFFDLRYCLHTLAY